MQLNISQTLAVKSKAPVVIGIAGAGAGKTRVMTCKIKELIDEGVDPNSILAITFTKKAANELIERIGNDKVTASTIHSFCYQILKSVHKHSTIWEPKDSEKAYKVVLERMNYEGDIARLRHSIDYAISDLSIQNSSMFKYFRAYHNYMRACNAFDFDSMQYDAYNLLSGDKGVLAGIKDRYKYIFVDEYQDVCRVQHEIIRLIRTDYLMVIGDPWQSIYGFRAGSPDYIEEWTNFPGSETIIFDTNYRNSVEINTKAQVLMGEQRVKICTNEHNGAIEDQHGYDEWEEADKLADIILSMTKEQRVNTAILYRTNMCNRPLTTVFGRRKIPYVVWGAFHLLDRADAKNAIAYLKLSLNRHDDIAFLRIVNSPTRGIGKKKLTAIQEYHPCYEYAIDVYRKELTDFRLLIDKIAGCKKVYDKIFLIRDEYIRKNTEFETEVFDILLDTAKAYHDVEEFLEYVTMSREDQAACGAVKLMTMHASKGLEFDNVLLYNINSGLVPHKNGQEEEERRLMYVAMTRAKNRVIISHNGNKSPYLYELGGVEWTLRLK